MTTEHAATSRRRRGGALVGLAAALTLAGGAPAFAYPPTPTDEALEVEFLEPECDQDIPYVSYTVSTVGFESSGPMTITVRDLDGNTVDSFVSDGLEGSFLYPGASVDPKDWPGWAEVDGEWVVDPSDARLRDGLSVTFQVNPSVTAVVDYPDADSGCADPDTGRRDSNIQGIASSGSLPSTGSTGVSTTLLAAGIALLLGLGLTAWTAVSNRRGSSTEHPVS